MSVYATFPVLGDSDQSLADACASRSLVVSFYGTFVFSLAIHIFGAWRFRLIACRRLCVEFARYEHSWHVFGAWRFRLIAWIGRALALGVASMAAAAPRQDVEHVVEHVAEYVVEQSNMLSNILSNMFSNRMSDMLLTMGSTMLANLGRRLMD